MLHIYFGSAPPAEIWWIPILAAVITGGLALIGVVLGLRGISRQIEATDKQISKQIVAADCRISKQIKAADDQISSQIKAAYDQQTREFNEKEEARDRSKDADIRASLIAIAGETFINLDALNASGYETIVDSIRRQAAAGRLPTIRLPFTFALEDRIMKEKLGEVGSHHPELMLDIIKTYRAIYKVEHMLRLQLDIVDRKQKSVPSGSIDQVEMASFAEQMRLCEVVAVNCREVAVRLITDIGKIVKVDLNESWGAVRFALDKRTATDAGGSSAAEP